MTNECPVCGGEASLCACSWGTVIGKVTKTLKGHAAQIAALQAAIKPAEPATEKPAKPTITKVGRVFESTKGTWDATGWRFNGEAEINMMMCSFNRSWRGYMFKELAREAVLNNPREGDRFKHCNDERIVKLRNGMMYAFNPETNSICDPMVEYNNTDINTDFRPIADAPEAKANPEPICACGHSDLSHDDHGCVTGCHCAGFQPHPLPVQPSEPEYRGFVGEMADAVGAIKLTGNMDQMVSVIMGNLGKPSEQAAQASTNILDNRKTLPSWCYYCKLTFLDDATVKAHRCPEHPLVQEITKLKAELAPLRAELSQRCLEAEKAFNAENQRLRDVLAALHEEKKQWESEWNSMGEANAAGFNEGKAERDALRKDCLALKDELAALKSATPGAEGKRLLEMISYWFSDRGTARDFGELFRVSPTFNGCRSAIREQAQKALTERQDLHIQDLLKSPHFVAKIDELVGAMKNP